MTNKLLTKSIVLFPLINIIWGDFKSKFWTWFGEVKSNFNSVKYLNFDIFSIKSSIFSNLLFLISKDIKLSNFNKDSGNEVKLL